MHLTYSLGLIHDVETFIILEMLEKLLDDCVTSALREDEVLLCSAVALGRIGFPLVPGPC